MELNEFYAAITLMAAKMNHEEEKVMQYKTVTIEHSRKLRNNITSELNDEYEQIINNLAKQGWKLLGIHPVGIQRKKGCLEVIFSLWGIFGGTNNYYQADILIFFKDF